MDRCPLCLQEAQIKSIDSLSRQFTIDCSICGKYIITNKAIRDLESRPETDKAKISSFTRSRNINNDLLAKISSGEIESNFVAISDILEIYPKSFSDRIDKILINLSKISKFTGDCVLINYKDYPVFYSDSFNITAFNFIVQFLSENHYIDLFHCNQKITSYVKDNYEENFYEEGVKARLSSKGWERIAELDKKAHKSNKVFVAMSFSCNLNSIYHNSIEKAIKECNYEPIRVDLIEHNDKICDQIAAEIKQSKFVVCDFTEHKGGVYFEAGYALGLSLPVIWTCRKDEIEKSHFDTRQYNHIVWSNENDLYTKLKNRIIATI